MTRRRGWPAGDSLSDLAELTDRFGPHPPTVQRLLRRMRLRLLAQQWQVDSIHLEDGYAVLTYLNRPRIEELAALRKKRLRIVDERSALRAASQDGTGAGWAD